MKTWWIIFRIIGFLLIVTAIWMYIEDKEFTTSFDSYDANRSVVHKDLSINYIKVIIIGLIVFFSKEIKRYLDYVKYY